MKKFESERHPPFSVILERTLNVSHFLNVILGFIPRIHAKHLSNVILGLVPRIHAKNSPLLDTRDRLFVTPEYDGNGVNIFTPENDHQWNFTKGLDVVCQCAALLERRVQSSTRVRKAQAVTRQTNPIGRSMIEMLGVLAIIGVLSVGGIAGYSKAMIKFKTNTLLQQISTIISNTQILYAQQNGHEGLNNETAIQMGVIPEELISSDGQTLIDAFGDEFQITDWGTDSWIYLAFGIQTTKKCLAIANADWNVFNPLIVALLSKDGIGECLNYCSNRYERKDSDPSCDGSLGKVVEKIPFSPADAAQICSSCSAEEPCYLILLTD